MTETITATVTSLDAARQRRYYIELANNHAVWQQIVASWELEGIVITDDNAEHAGRMIARHAMTSSEQSPIPVIGGVPDLTASMTPPLL